MSTYTGIAYALSHQAQLRKIGVLHIIAEAWQNPPSSMTMMHNNLLSTDINEKTGRVDAVTMMKQRLMAFIT